MTTKVHIPVWVASVQEDFRLILDIVTVLAAASAGGFLASVLRQPVLLGYLLAGILVGPAGLGWIKEIVQVETLAQFGVTFLLFTLGVEFSLKELRKVRGIAIGGGILQISLTILITAVLAVASGWLTPVQGIFLGAVLSLSSTAVVLKSLTETNQMGTPQAQAMLGILIVQDLAVGLMLAVLPALDYPLPELAGSVGKALLEIGLVGLGAVVAGIWLVPGFLRLLAQRENKEVFLLGVISLCVGIALLTDRIGISSEIGAFIAGLMISEVEYADQTLDYVEPLRDVFAALFFAAIGMLIDPSFIASHLLLILTLVGLVMVGKLLIIAPLVRLFRYSLSAAVLVGLGLSQIGEFSFVLASEGQSLGLVSRQTYLLIVSTTAVTLLITPFLLKLAPRLFAWLEGIPAFARWLESGERPRAVAPDTPARGHVVVCGYGQVGQDIVRLLEARHHELLVIDQSERVIQQLRSRGIPYVYGNAASALVLEKANLPQARTLVIALPDRMSIRLCLKRALELAPQLDVVVRATHKEDIEQLYQLGAREVVHPEFEASLGLCSHVLLELGEPLAIIQQEILTIRNSHYRDLRPLHPSCLIPTPLSWLTEQTALSTALDPTHNGTGNLSNGKSGSHLAWWEHWQRPVQYH
ncbi:cation:proton antiporter [Synechococcus sp. Nb3U1]|uniref:cation:proton antiporter n=1 Tax=Synechococcus sp. Nb3U1 TaxID=1914529 RepID=UPI002286A513|nr:cation:proton antiporter [Synechococcus sp. Nb3U1]